MTVHAGKGLTRNAPNVFVLIDDAKRPLVLVGEIFPQSSQGRESPPACFSGFETPGTAFARCHIMAREPGGCDDPRQVGAGPEEPRDGRGVAEGASAAALGLELDQALGIAAAAHRRRGVRVMRHRQAAGARA